MRRKTLDGAIDRLQVAARSAREALVPALGSVSMMRDEAVSEIAQAVVLLERATARLTAASQSERKLSR